MAKYTYGCTNSKECHYSEEVEMSMKDNHPEILKDCPNVIIKEPKPWKFTEKKCKGKLKRKITGGTGFVFK